MMALLTLTLRANGGPGHGFLEQDDEQTLVHHPAFQVLAHFLTLGGVMFSYRGIF
jgi:hypothetical protein